ncbi:MAG: hypothetical protein LUD12_09955 [Lachnospiraceae bacterium]|nr:hypothetical protein [Lachnospiraceae bacterium]
MSRPKRELKKKFIVFCEGDTEYHYIDQMRKTQGVEISIKPINMPLRARRMYIII